MSVARKAAAGHLPALRSGWRNVPFAGQREQLTHGDAVLALETLYRGDHAVVQVGGVAVTVRGPLDRPEVDGVRQACRVVEDADRLFVADASGVSAFGVVPLFPPPADEGPAGGCTAPMPGRVVAVHVTPGQDVEKGHVLVILEAMKMEQTLQAPHAGRVEAVHCAPGDLVDAGAVLITLAEAEAGPS